MRELYRTMSNEEFARAVARDAAARASLPSYRPELPAGAAWCYGSFRAIEMIRMVEAVRRSSLPATIRPTRGHTIRNPDERIDAAIQGLHYLTPF